jgi:transposase
MPKSVVLTGGKKVKGHKRHIVTDTQGRLLFVRVHAANIHDTKGGCAVFKQAVEAFPSLKGVCADAGYRKTFEEFTKGVLGKTVEIVERIREGGWAVIAKRWIVERTFAWLNSYRRLSKDFERTISSAEAFVRIAHCKLLLNRLSKL